MNKANNGDCLWRCRQEQCTQACQAVARAAGTACNLHAPDWRPMLFELLKRPLALSLKVPSLPSLPACSEPWCGSGPLLAGSWASPGKRETPSFAALAAACRVAAVGRKKQCHEHWEGAVAGN
jgi:hypothetical protein